MILKEYQDWVESKMSDKSMANIESKLATGGLGIAGEAGECADIMKKVLFQGMEFDEKTKGKLIEELGDLMFYIAFTSKIVCEISIEEIIENNVKKLNERYKNKFTVEEFNKKENL